MDIPPLPDEPGVRFRGIPNHSLYLVSDDTRVWIARRRYWREMKPHKNADGQWCVWLMNDKNTAGEEFVINELVQQIFGGE